jgi:hypothetical protein
LVELGAWWSLELGGAWSLELGGVAWSLLVLLGAWWVVGGGGACCFGAWWSLVELACWSLQLVGACSLLELEALLTGRNPFLMPHGGLEAGFETIADEFRSRGCATHFIETGSCFCCCVVVVVCFFTNKKITDVTPNLDALAKQPLYYTHLLCGPCLGAGGLLGAWSLERGGAWSLVRSLVLGA